MLRKTIFAIAATALVGTAALAPTTASAWGYKKHHHHHHHFRPHFYHGINAFVVNDYVGGCVLKKRWVATPYGMAKKWVKVCY